MASKRTPRKIQLLFFRNEIGHERDGLKGLDQAERHAIGADLLRAQWRCPVSMLLCRALGRGLCEVRTDLPGNQTARVLICL
jgi:hypothetical protein